MEITKVNDKDVNIHILSSQKRLDSFVLDEYRKGIDEAKLSGADIILDLQKTEYIDSITIAWILSLVKEKRERMKKGDNSFFIALTQFHPSLNESFKVLNILDVLGAHHGIQEAVDEIFDARGI